ncbi:MAG TPA: acyl-CoA dehydratase activase [Tetragenococcus sp.]|nr:acyl-CoA dehydratase activase [Tetragenococcus sp.]
MNYIGLDSGSTMTKGVLFSDEKLIKTRLLPTAGNPKKAMENILADFKEDGPAYLITTGYGRKILAADLTVTEITCHGKGAEYLYPGIRQVIDVGGQDCKTIRLNGKGGVLDFNMNDKCAAGTGRFVEVMVTTLGEKIEHLDDFVQDAQAVKINSMCTVFAESEVIGLISKGEKTQDIALGVLHSISKRISSQFAKIRPQKGQMILLTGGLSHSQRFVQTLSQYLAAPVSTDPLAQFAGAIGAAQMGIKKLS